MNLSFKTLRMPAKCPAMLRLFVASKILFLYFKGKQAPCCNTPLIHLKNLPVPVAVPSPCPVFPHAPEERKGRKGTRGQPRTPERHRGSAPDPAGGNDSPRAPSSGRAKGDGNAKSLLRLAAVPGTRRRNVPVYRHSVARLRAGVRCRAHLRWPTPSRPAPGRRFKGKDFRIG